MTEFTIASLTGGKEAILSNLVAQPAWLAEKYHSIGSTMERAVGIAASIAKGKLYDMAYPELEKRLAAFLARNGPRPPFPQEQAAAGEWDSAMDDEVASVFEPYANVLSADWLGRATVDTRLHMEGEEARLMASFAKEAWKQLTYEKNTTAKILSAVGIVSEDIEALLAASHVQDARTVVELEPDMAMNAVLNKIMLHAGPAAQIGDIALVCNDETDEFILPQAMARLGIDTEDVETLRVAVMMGQDTQAMFDMVQSGELLDEEDGADPFLAGISAKTEDEAADEASEAVGAVGGEVAESALPPPVKLGRTPRKPTAPVEGQIPAVTLVALKTFANIKDEDAAAIVGVSRATYNNFVKNKTPFVPTEPQRAALREMVRSKINGLLTGVLSTFDGVPYDEIQ